MDESGPSSRRASSFPDPQGVGQAIFFVVRTPGLILKEDLKKKEGDGRAENARRRIDNSVGRHAGSGAP